MLGLSDPAWGEQVAAVIDAADPADPPTAAELHDHLRAALAPAQDTAPLVPGRRHPSQRHGKDPEVPAGTADQ